MRAASMVSTRLPKHLEALLQLCDALADHRCLEKWIEMLINDLLGSGFREPIDGRQPPLEDRVGVVS